MIKSVCVMILFWSLFGIANAQTTQINFGPLQTQNNLSELIGKNLFNNIGGISNNSTTYRNLGSRFNDTINVLDYGAVSNPTVDNTASIQNAINAACSVVSTSSNGTEYPSGASTGGGDVFIPQGKYGIVGPLNWTCPVHIHGAGRGTTTLVWIGSGNYNLINMSAPLTDGNRYWRYGAVHDIDIANGGSQTGGAIKISQCTECEIYNIGTYGMYRSVVVYAGFHNNIHDFAFMQGHVQATNGVVTGTEAFSTAFELYGSDNNGGTGCTATNNGNCLTRGDIVNIYSGSVDSGLDGVHEPTDCIYHHDFMGTVWVSHLNCNQVRIGYNASCENSTSLGACPAFIHLDRLEVETNNTVGTNNNHGILADNFEHMEAFSTQLFSSQSGGSLIGLSNTRFHSGHFEWHGGKIQNSSMPCVQSRIDTTQWFGGEILSCGNGTASNSGNHWGIQFLSGGVGNSTNNQVIGMSFCHDGLGGTDSEMYPVDISTAATYTLVSGSMLQNCAGTSSNNNSSGNNLIVNEVGP